MNREKFLLKIEVNKFDTAVFDRLKRKYEYMKTIFNGKEFISINADL
jgi:hypothetical protein